MVAAASSTTQSAANEQRARRSLGNSLSIGHRQDSSVTVQRGGQRGGLQGPLLPDHDDVVEFF